MSDPKAIRGDFIFTVNNPPKPQGPVIAALGVYELFPDADIRISFSGTIRLPPGKWEVGIVQNSWNDRVSIMFSKGGEWYFSQNSKPLLDTLEKETDIWLNTFGTGVRTFNNNTSGDKEFFLLLQAGDTPTSPLIPGMRKDRAGGSITELLVFAERTLQLVAVIVARRGGRNGEIFQLAATAGQPYGFAWRLEPANGQPNFRFQSFRPTRVETVPPFSLFIPSGLATKPPKANDFGKGLWREAEDRYLSDPGIRPPVEGIQFCGLEMWHAAIVPL